VGVLASIILALAVKDKDWLAGYSFLQQSIGVWDIQNNSRTAWHLA
jgi:hypothetical protein